MRDKIKDNLITRAYKIDADNLSRASHLFNQSSDGFLSYIENIIPDQWKGIYIVIVKTTDDYPFITNQWKSIIVEEHWFTERGYNNGQRGEK